MPNVFSKFYDFVNASLDSRIESLKQSGEDLAKAQRADGTFGRKGLIFDPFMEQYNSGGLFKPKTTYLSNNILKQVSRRDPVVAAIVDVRASQVASACRKQTSRFDIGFKIQPKDKTSQSNTDEVRQLEEFILNTGRTEDRPHQDKMSFDQWGYIVTRDMLVYGHFAVEKVKRSDGDLHSFLPLAAETIFYANKKVDKKVIETMKDTFRQAFEKMTDQTIIDKAANGDYEFVQVIDGKVTEGFTRDELIFARYALESDIDLNGYSLGPLERAVSAIISHMQIQNHQRQFFTHGQASKGLLVIQGDVAPSTLKTLQTQWNNQVTGPLNAWRTPILAGIKGVQWVPLSPTSRDMEYANWQDTVLRQIFAIFGMNPMEAGFDYLSRGTEQRSLSESSNEYKLEASRDRGLRPILNRLEAVINEEILPSYSKELSEKYHFAFVGLNAETEMEEVQRLQAETALHTSLNEARKQIEREPLNFGGELILNPLLIDTMQKNMTKGQFMEAFMGVQGASQRPDLQYIPDPMWFQWQSLQIEMMQMQAGAMLQESGEAQPSEREESSQAGGREDGEDDQPEGPSPEQIAVEQYIAANPELFKTIQANWDKADELQKSLNAKKKIRTDHVEKMTAHLVKDFRKASDRLVKEILEVVKEDIEGGSKNE